MTEWQEVMERTTSPTFCCKSSSKGSFSTDMYGCIFHSFSAWYIVYNAFSSEPAAVRRRSADHSFINTDLEWWIVQEFVDYFEILTPHFHRMLKEGMPCFQIEKRTVISEYEESSKHAVFGIYFFPSSRSRYLRMQKLRTVQTPQ
jgi:hypothetical protein